MAFTIPEEHRVSILAVAQFSPEMFSQLLVSLRDLSPKHGLAELSDRLEQVIPIQESLNRRTLAETLVSMYASLLRSGMPTAEFAKNIADAILVTQPAAFDGQALSNRLNQLLCIDAIRLSAKASELRVDHDRVYNSSRVVSDLRPIFNEPVESGLSGFMLIHQLKIVSMRRGKPEELFFAMDEKDLESLKTTLERAEIKSKQIRELLHEKQLAEYDGER